MKTVKRTLTPAKAVKILAGYGTEISLEEAEIMLDFLHDFIKPALEVQQNPEPQNQGIFERMNNVAK